MGSYHFEKHTMKLLQITSIRFEPTWVSTLHTHAFVELMYIINGKGSMLVKGETLTIQEDDLIIIPASLEHTEIVDNIPLEYISIGIKGIVLTDDNTSSISIHHYQDCKHAIRFYIQALLWESEHIDCNSTLVSENLLELIIIQILRQSNTKINTAPTKVISDCIAIDNYLQTHFVEDITLDHLANIVNMDKYYFVHAFKKYKGISPINYLLSIRLKEAKRLLETTDIAIATICTMVGFSSQSYFSQIFRKSQHSTPLQYRKSFTK